MVNKYLHNQTSFCREVQGSRSNSVVASSGQFPRRRSVRDHRTVASNLPNESRPWHFRDYHRPKLLSQRRGTMNSLFERRAPFANSKQTVEQRNVSGKRESCVQRNSNATELPPVQTSWKSAPTAFCRELRYQWYFRHLDEHTPFLCLSIRNNGTGLCVAAIRPAPGTKIQFRPESRTVVI